MTELNNRILSDEGFEEDRQKRLAKEGVERDIRQAVLKAGVKHNLSMITFEPTETMIDIVRASRIDSCCIDRLRKVGAGLSD